MLINLGVFNVDAEIHRSNSERNISGLCYLTPPMFRDIKRNPRVLKIEEGGARTRRTVKGGKRSILHKGKRRHRKRKKEWRKENIKLGSLSIHRSTSRDKQFFSFKN